MQEPGVVMVAVLVLVCSTQAGKQRGSHSARAAVECRHHLFRTRAPANSVVFINGLIIVLCASRRGRHLLPQGSLSLSLPSRLSVVAQHARPGHRGAPCRRQIRQSALSSLALVACAHLASTPSGQNHLGRASAHGLPWRERGAKKGGGHWTE